MTHTKRVAYSSSFELKSKAIRIPTSILATLALCACGDSNISPHSLDKNIITQEKAIESSTFYPAPILKPFNNVSEKTKKIKIATLQVNDTRLPIPVLKPLIVASTTTHTEKLNSKRATVDVPAAPEQKTQILLTNIKDRKDIPWLRENNAELEQNIISRSQVAQAEIKSINANDKKISKNTYKVASPTPLLKPSSLQKRNSSIKDVNGEIKFLMGQLEKEEFYSALSPKQKETPSDANKKNVIKETFIVGDLTNKTKIKTNSLTTNSKVSEGVWHLPDSIDVANNNTDETNHKNVTELLSNISSPELLLDGNKNPIEQEELIQSLSRKVFLLEREKEALRAKIKN